jgi:UDP-glucuronate 4-epimerase
VPEHIVVTGAAGFIGSSLVDSLLARGYEVTGIDNFDPFYAAETKRANLADALSHPCFRLVEADIRDRAAMAEVFERRPDVLVHLAARAGVRPSILDPVLYADVNVVGTSVLLEAARATGLERIVVASSSSVYGNSATPPFREDDPALRPVSPYAATKRACELLCETFVSLNPTVRLISLRFFTVYGPRQRPDLAIHKFTRLISDGRPIPFFGDGSFSRDYTYITDTLQGVQGAIERTAHAPPGHEVYNLGESATTTLSDLVALLESAIGKPAVLDRQPEQPGDVVRTFADISRARAMLGYAPRVSVEEGIPLFVAWFNRTRRAGTPVAARG